MENSCVVLCNCVIVFAVLGNALCMYRAVSTHSSSSSESDDGVSSSFSKSNQRDRNPVTGHGEFSVKGDSIWEGDRELRADPRGYEVASVTAKGHVVGPARIKLVREGLFGKRVIFLKYGENAVIHGTSTIRGYRCSDIDETNVMITDSDNIRYTITFLNEDDARSFENAI